MSELLCGNGGRILRLREQRIYKAIVVQEEVHSGNWRRTPRKTPHKHVILPRFSLQGMQDARLELLGYRSPEKTIGENRKRRRWSSEKEISRATNLPWMQSGQHEVMRGWFAHGRWALVLAFVGGAILSFVVVTRGTYGAWMMWIAVPFLMISLGYFYVVNALPVFTDESANHQSETEQQEKPREE